MSNNKKLPKRSEVSQDYKWKLTDLYKNNTLFEEDYAFISKNLNSLNKYQGTLSDSSKNLLECLEESDKLSIILDKLYVYSFMYFHEDSQNAVAQELADKAETLLIAFSSAISFIIPEILSIPKEILSKFELENPDAFLVYKHFLENITRQKSHILSKKEEILLAEASELGGAPQTIFSMLNDADMKFPNIKDKNGIELELTHGRYTTFLESEDRILRKSAFDALYETYEKQKNTIASIYSSSVKSDVFFARARNYDSSIALALDDDNIPISVYENLIQTVEEYLPLLHRYISLRKKMLGVDELHLYDLYVPLVPEANLEIPYSEACETVLSALSVLGEDYVKVLKDGYNGGWIDIYENEGKRSGAYSWGTYTAHPYVLLNHNDNLNSMFTLAHEMGHALHSYFTWKKQPYQYSGHKIFVAEVASTCNEALLMNYLLKRTEDPSTKKYLINYFMEQFRGTFFRQTMFAEFEKITHDMAENSKPLTCETLSTIYYDLNKKYFGKDIVIDESIALEWARIPHFYNAFYVYQYATGYSAAIALSKKMQEGGQNAINDYLDFLSKGQSEYSIDLLKGAGVDMTTTKPLKDAMSVFEDLLNQMENL